MQTDCRLGIFVSKIKRFIKICYYKRHTSLGGNDHKRHTSLGGNDHTVTAQDNADSPYLYVVRTRLCWRFYNGLYKILKLN